jgi:hypothetical protein
MQWIYIVRWRDSADEWHIHQCYTSKEEAQKMVDEFDPHYVEGNIRIQSAALYNDVDEMREMAAPII